jgi:hypothetical protein
VYKYCFVVCGSSSPTSSSILSFQIQTQLQETDPPIDLIIKMQFTVAASFLLAAVATASPSSPIQERQASSVTATFYSSTGCNKPADIITPPSPDLLVQDTAPCHNITIGQTVGCTAFSASTLTRPSTLEFDIHMLESS